MFSLKSITDNGRLQPTTTDDRTYCSTPSLFAIFENPFCKPFEVDRSCFNHRISKLNIEHRST